MSNRSRYTYGDFLPASAAGIFHSNLGTLAGLGGAVGPDQEALEKAFGCAVVDGDALYQAQQLESMTAMLEGMRASCVKADVTGGVHSVF